MKTIRSFLAVKLDLKAIRGIADAQAGLKRRCDQEGVDVRWVPPPNMHVTMRFLGNIAEPTALALKDMLEPVMASFAVFEVRAGGLGAFPDFQRPRVVWAGLREGAETLGRWYDAIARRLDGAGFAIDGRPFAPHVTIGRVKGGRIEALEGCLAEGRDRSFGLSIVRNLYCYRSDLSSAGAEYHTLWRIPVIDTGGVSRQAEERIEDRIEDRTEETARPSLDDGSKEE